MCSTLACDVSFLLVLVWLFIFTYFTSFHIRVFSDIAAGSSTWLRGSVYVKKVTVDNTTVVPQFQQILLLLPTMGR